MTTNGSTSNTGILYLLLSEGEIELVNGLSSIFLNRTPIANESAATKVQAYQRYGTKVSSTVFRIVGRYEVDDIPILVYGGQDQDTVAAYTNAATQTTIQTSGSFFTSNMVNSNISAPANFKPRIRIPGGNLDGSEYVGDVISYTNSTTAVITPALDTSPVGKIIMFDYYSDGNSITTYSDNGYLVISTVTLDTAIPNYANLANSFRVMVDSLTSNLADVPEDQKNFKNVRVAFRPGTENQEPVTGIPSFTNASLGVNLNAQIKQHSDYFTSTITGFWGKYSLKHPSGATADSASYSINASQVSPGSANEVDELAVTIGCPQGLYAANSEGSPRQWGAVFQIWFSYKNGANSWKSELVLGPTDAEIAAATILVAADSGTFRQYGPKPTGSIYASSKTPIDFDFRFNVEQYKPFDDFKIEIKKVTPDNLEYNNDVMVCTTYVKSAQAYINDKLTYPFSAYLAIAFDSNETGGEFPEVTAECYGIRQDLPTNYITREESDTGIAKYTRNSSGVDTGSYVVWDGNFRRGYSNNPVWCLRELLLNKRWGLGNWLSEENIDDYSLYAMARYCDELVPDGLGGYEPRFACNVYLTTAEESYKVIKDFCTIMLAIPYWVDGQLTLEGDRPTEPVATFTKGNIEGGIFSYEGTSNKTRPNQIVVRYNNKDLFYEQDVELVDDVENMLSTGKIFSEEVVAFGATTRGQALRYGKWKLLTATMQKEIVTFKTGENAGYLRPGNVIYIQDADRNSVRYSGRLKGASGINITLDGPVTNTGNDFMLHAFIEGPAVYLRQDSATYGGSDYVYGDLIALNITSEADASELVDDSGDPITVQFVPDAHLESRSIAAISGTSVILSSAFSSDPELDTIWAITESVGGNLVAGSPKEYKILAISENMDGTFDITAAEHFNSKFDLIDEEFLATPQNIVPRYTEVPPITNFVGTASSSRITNDSEIASTSYSITLTWDSPKEWVGTVQTLYQYFDRYMLEVIDPTGNVSNYPISKNANSYSINNVVTGLYSFKLVAKSDVGPVSPPARTTVSVRAPSNSAANVVSVLPKGGSITVPIAINAGAIVTGNNYKFTAVSGRVLYKGPDEPESPSLNDRWYDTTGPTLKYYDGSTWQTV